LFSRLFPVFTVFLRFTYLRRFFRFSLAVSHVSYRWML
jgi:hypothetical protein